MSCCQLVGNIDPVGEYVLSVQIKSDTEMSKVGRTLIVGPTVGSVVVTGYATRHIHKGCPGRAGVTIPWMKKYDCDRNEVHLIFMGAGRSYISGDVESLASVYNGVVRYPILNASAASGPTAMYEDTDQLDGFGLRYSGRPYSFDTSYSNGVRISMGGVGNSNMYLQSFSLQCNPGQVPIATYNLIFINTNN